MVAYLKNKALTVHVVLLISLFGFINFLQPTFAIINPVFQRIIVNNLIFALPVLLFLNGFLFKRVKYKVINGVIFFIPAVMGSLFFPHIINDFAYGYPQTAHVQLGGYEVNAYRSSVWMGGDGCYVFQEKQIFPGVKLVKKILGVYRCYESVTIKKIENDAVEIGGITCDDCNLMFPKTFYLKPFVYY